MLIQCIIIVRLGWTLLLLEGLHSFSSKACNGEAAESHPYKEFSELRKIHFKAIKGSPFQGCCVFTCLVDWFLERG